MNAYRPSFPNRLLPEALERASGPVTIEFSTDASAVVRQCHTFLERLHRIGTPCLRATTGYGAMVGHAGRQDLTNHGLAMIDFLSVGQAVGPWRPVDRRPAQTSSAGTARVGSRAAAAYRSRRVGHCERNIIDSCCGWPGMHPGSSIHHGFNRVERADAGSLGGAVPSGRRPLQEPYSLRCVPQLVGAVRNASEDVLRIRTPVRPSSSGCAKQLIPSSVIGRWTATCGTPRTSSTQPPRTNAPLGWNTGVTRPGSDSMFIAPRDY